MSLSENLFARRLSADSVKRPSISRAKCFFAGPPLVTLICFFLLAGTVKWQIQRTGPLDQLRQEFLTKSQTNTFQVSQVQVTGKIVAVDGSRKDIFRQLMIRNPASREKLGEYVESVILDDGQSQAKAACSAFEKDRQRGNSLLDSTVQLSPGQTITVSGTFFGAYQAGAVELLSCSLLTSNSAASSSATSPAQTTSPQNQSLAQSRGVTGAISAVSLLAEAKQASVTAFHQKYAGRSVTFTGIVDWTYGSNIFPTHGIVLMGKFHDDGDVFCDLLPSEINAVKQVTKDQLITITGRFDPKRVYFEDENTIQYNHNRNVKLVSCKVLDFHASAPSDMQFPEPKPLGPSSPALSGLYMHSQFQVQAGFSSRTDWYFYFFSPDGHVYADCPRNGELDHFDFAAAAKKEPRLVGYYRVSGNRIEFVWFAGRKPESSEFGQKGSSLNFLGDTWDRADTDTGKQRPNWIVGTYRFQIGMALQNVSALNSSFYTWKADGTFTAATSGGAGTSAGVPQANTSHSSRAGGTYTLSGTMLTLKFSDGRVERHTAFPYGKSIFLDGTMFIPTQ
jgi:hypothetical protein